MVQPLPTAVVPSALGLIEAQRQGVADRQQQEQRDLMKRAGGLAATGNLTGARSELYKGGDFSGASSLSTEMRAASSHAKSLDNDKLERALKGQGLLGRLAGSIKTPEEFETAKERLKGMGFNVENVTFDQLPALRQQSLSVQDQLSQELNQRKLDIIQQKVDAKAGTAPKLTEGQAASRNFLGMAETAQGILSGDAKKPGLLGAGGTGESPMSTWDTIKYNNIPSDAIANRAIDKHSRRYIQAAMSFVRAKLRKESGATISPDEFRQDFLTYFPQPGDDPGTRKQKATMRKQVLEGLKIQGGLVPGVVSNAPANAASNQPTALPDDPSQLSDDDLMKLLE